MEKDNWNPNDWQGRSKKQVEDNYKMLDWTFAIAGVLFFGWAFFMVIKNLIG